MRNTKKSMLSLECVGKRSWFATKFTHFHGTSASAQCDMEFDLLQIILFLQNCVYLLMT